MRIDWSTYVQYQIAPDRMLPVLLPAAQVAQPGALGGWWGVLVRWSVGRCSGRRWRCYYRRRYRRRGHYHHCRLGRVACRVRVEEGRALSPPPPSGSTMHVDQEKVTENVRTINECLEVRLGGRLGPVSC